MDNRDVHAAGERLEQALRLTRQVHELLRHPLPIAPADAMLDAGEGVMSHIETAQEIIARALALVEAEITRAEVQSTH